MALQGRWSNKPPLLLADEPTGNLDPELAREIMDLFHQFNQVGVTVLIATHALDLVARMAKRELILRQGELTEAGFGEWSGDSSNYNDDYNNGGGDS